MMLSNRLVSRLSHPLRILSRSATASSESSSSSTSVTKTTVATPAPQAPNYPTKWSTSQRSRPVGGESPRFEQTAMDLQPQPLSAMEMINAEPIRIVHGRKAVCDGGECSWRIPLKSLTLFWVTGGGPLGHPKVFINLVCILPSTLIPVICLIMRSQDKPGARPCGYDSLVFLFVHRLTLVQLSEFLGIGMLYLLCLYCAVMSDVSCLPSGLRFEQAPHHH
jgi:NADH dehydrogenase (ubiquinone) Fe-S protein 6